MCRFSHPRSHARRRPPQAAAVEHEGEAALAQLGPELERLLGHARTQPGAVVVDRPARLVVAAPAVNARPLLLGDAALPGAVLEGLQTGTRE